MTARTRPRLHLDPATVRQARALARKAGRPIVRLARPAIFAPDFVHYTLNTFGDLTPEQGVVDCHVSQGV